jgi:hypothetical protein
MKGRLACNFRQSWDYFIPSCLSKGKRRRNAYLLKIKNNESLNDFYKTTSKFIVE